MSNLNKSIDNNNKTVASVKTLLNWTKELSFMLNTFKSVHLELRYTLPKDCKLCEVFVVRSKKILVVDTSLLLNFKLL